MSALDSLADKARAKSRELAGQGGIKDKLAEELAEDAEFLRKLKPELIKQRAKGHAPTDEKPGAHAPQPTVSHDPEQHEPAEPAKQEQERVTVAKPPKARKASGGSGGGPNPFVVIGIALVAGIALAKWLDWRGHAHPRW